ncbi:MAG: bifunctional oligoribonuclease/PAP phosphatase NrnA [Bdellovibrionales bacterium]|nr:bifunctional oligoribonuclease/PAP phosphatase NrnA [Bdellovibrionales bacterium]
MNPKIQSFGETLEFLASHDDFLVLSHFNPDPDAYGAQTAFHNLLLSLNKRSCLVNQDGALDRYSAVPGIDQVLSECPDSFSPRTLVYLDCGGRDRIGARVMTELQSKGYLSLPSLNVDHHISNDHFGTVNFVDGDRSSTCEMVYELFEALKVPLNAEGAFQLLCGIVGDTGSFRYPSTSPRTLRIAALLVEAGGDLAAVSQNVIAVYTESSLLLQANALLGIRRTDDGKIAGVIVREEDYQKFHANIIDTENLAERVRDIQGVAIAYAIRAAGDVWKVSLRTSLETLDLSAVAASFGGGGHRAASAFRFRGELADLERALLERLQKVLVAKAKEVTSRNKP